MSLHAILTTYWNQTLIILAVISYFGKRIFDLISKKREINHSIFQQRRLDSINSFFSIYAETEQLWADINTYEIFRREINTKQLDDMVYPTYNELKRNVLELQIYFNEHEHENFVKILKNITLIKSKLGEIYFDYEVNKTITQKSNNFQFYRDEKLQENEVVFKKVTESLKKTFQ